MTENLKTAINVVTQLTPDEQLELIATVSRALQKRFPTAQQSVSGQPPSAAKAIPSTVRRTPPMQQLSQLKAEFWPEDETADDINNFVEQQRKDDLRREFNEYGAA
ncbi:MAG: hypothetical protein JNM09_02220 [Blastocatellia bacterium]|nr:hypothetical protein [Blastocatellia bacterium]